jgi:hypothetical protein
MLIEGNSQEPEAVEAAPGEVDTTTTQPVEEQPSEDQEQEQQEPRQFTQEELDKIVAAEKAKVERKLRRELAEKANAPRPLVQPKPEDYANQADYIEAAAQFKAEQIVAEKEAKQQQAAVRDSYDDREEAIRAKYSDYEEVALLDTDKGGPAISNTMAEVIMESEIGPEIAYYLGKNVEESKQIWAMKPALQAAALGKIEAKLTAKPPAKPASNAPEPITPVHKRATTPAINPADPRSIEKTSVSEWIAARNKQVQNRK